MFPQLARFTDLALLLLRLMVGLVFITSGSHLKDPEARSKSIEMSKGFTVFLGIAEVAGALGIAFGVLTQLAAFGLIALMLLGASVVTTLFTDEESTLLRYHHASDESFDRVPEWLHAGIAAAYRGGAARLAVSGSNPALLAGQDPQKVSRANLALSKASRPALECERLEN